MRTLKKRHLATNLTVSTDDRSPIPRLSRVPLFRDPLTVGFMPSSEFRKVSRGPLRWSRDLSEAWTAGITGESGRGSRRAHLPCRPPSPPPHRPLGAFAPAHEASQLLVFLACRSWLRSLGLAPPLSPTDRVRHRQDFRSMLNGAPIDQRGEFHDITRSDRSTVAD